MRKTAFALALLLLSIVGFGQSIELKGKWFKAEAYLFMSSQTDFSKPQYSAQSLMDFIDEKTVNVYETGPDGSYDSESFTRTRYSVQVFQNHTTLTIGKATYLIFQNSNSRFMLLTAETLSPGDPLKFLMFNSLLIRADMAPAFGIY